MAYDEELADRMRGLLTERTAFTEQKMFGGIGFMVGGHLAVGASSGGGMIVRTDPEGSDQLIATTDADPFEMKGRGMRGWLHIQPGHVQDDVDLARWVDVGVDYASSLPPKS